MGESAEIARMIKSCFPGLVEDKSFKLTSPADPNYNCIAWAYQKDDQWMQPPGGVKLPFLDGVTFWPEGASKTTKISSLVEAFQTKGYEKCDTYTYEEDFMKVALYWNPLTQDWTHAARQHRDGTWTSKLGRGNDIQHGTPFSIEGEAYGKVYCFMKRAVVF